MNIVTTKIPKFIFWSRWLQAPLYLGLIVVLAIYVFEFAHGLILLIKSAGVFNSTNIMLRALDLIDVVMIANLLIMVIVGGYETFVSRLRMQNHQDHPEWLDEVNAGTMKVKLALALITISSIHLLRTFIDPTQYTFNAIMWQVVIHITLVGSAIAIAFAEKIMNSTKLNSKSK
ncbi:TIGR00645 family protein [Gammaproteobacteria bacterium]|nr:TIGR00645 family protein [Gammaproteobacteria bacterium]